jgi:hypothetical protein
MAQHIPTMIPMQILADIDNSRNPMQLTRERLERAATENQFMNGKIAAIDVSRQLGDRVHSIDQSSSLSHIANISTKRWPKTFQSWRLISKHKQRKKSRTVWRLQQNPPTAPREMDLCCEGIGRRYSILCEALYTLLPRLRAILIPHPVGLCSTRQWRSCCTCFVINNGMVVNRT